MTDHKITINNYVKLFSIFFIIYFYRLGNYSLKIDDELAYFREDPSVWVAQGRWAAYLFENFILQNPSIPYYPLLLFGLFGSAAFLLSTHTREINNYTFGTFIEFAIFIGFPTWFLMAAFSGNIAAIGMGLLLISTAAYIFKIIIISPTSTTQKPLKILLYLLMAIIAAAAVGIYQAFILVLGVNLIGLIIFDSLKNNHSKGQFFKLIIDILIICSLSIALYSAINKIFIYLLEIKPDNYINGKFFKYETLIKYPLFMLGEVYRQALKIYGGSKDLFAVQIQSIPILILLSTLTIIISIKRSPINFPLKISTTLMVGALLITPFSLSLIAGQTPTRLLISVPSAISIIFSFALFLSKSHIHKLINITGFIVILASIHSNSILMGSEAIVNTHDRLLAHQIVSKITAIENSSSHKHKYMKIDISGAYNFRSSHPRPVNSTWGQSFFDWDNGNPERIVNYLNYLGYGPYKTYTDQERLSNQELFIDMPSWPDEKSILKTADGYLIKLSSTNE